MSKIIGIKHSGYISDREIKEYEKEGYFLKQGQKIHSGIGCWDFIKQLN